MSLGAISIVLSQVRFHFHLAVAGDRVARMSDAVAGSISRMPTSFE
jgi:hypothetical protein